MTRAGEPLRVAILISGRGSNMLAIATAPYASYQVGAVVSDRARAAGLAAARELGLHTEVVAPGQHQPRPDYDRELASALRRHAPGLVVLAGFMRILGREFVEEFAGRLLNIHPSLLPNYTGLHTHARVLSAGEREHGCSVHFVTEELDGGPVIVQARVPVLAGDDVTQLQARVLHEEHRIYPMTVDWFATGRLQWRDGTPWLDGAPLRGPVVLDSSKCRERVAGDVEP